MTSNETEGVDVQEHVRQKILLTLKIYPKLSRSMLQIGIGTGLPPIIWGPVLDQMVERGEIVIDLVVALSAGGRNLTHNVIRLAEAGTHSTEPASQVSQSTDPNEQEDGAHVIREHIAQ